MFSFHKFYFNCLKPSALQTLLRNSKYSTAKLTPAIESSVLLENNKDEIKTEVVQNVPTAKHIKSGSLVAAAFASLRTENGQQVLDHKVTYNDKRINKATTVDELLGIVDQNILSRQHALKIVSTLAQWSTSGKINLSDFETDPRFVKVCRILSRTSVKNKGPSRIRDDDLSMVLGVTGDDEAAKLVASITLPQMIKVMSSLSQKKRRSTPLLRSLAYNISRSSSKLDLKQCADLLYSMTILNFPEPVLLERIVNDTVEVLNTNDDRSAVVGSILTSIGLLRYKNAGLLDALSDWILKHYEICRPQDIFSLFLTLAITNHHPENDEKLFKVLVPQLNISDVQKPALWLDIIWSLVVLNQATEQHVSSVFNSEFINKLQEKSPLSIPSKMKLLNINAACQYLWPKYNGPLLKDVVKENLELTLSRTKEKQLLVSAVLDSLGSLLPSQTYLRSNINSKMGFFIDGVCSIDKKCNPLPVEDSNPSPDKIKIAIMVYDFHDSCKGSVVPHGGIELSEKLLKATGYKIIRVPYSEFNPRDKIVHRVQYLEKQLRHIASSAL